MNEFVDYKEIIFLSLQLDFDGEVHIKRKHYAKGFTRGKMMYLSYDSVRPEFLFHKATERTSVDTNDTLYVSKASTLSRDLIRKTGYKITISKDKADKIVVPQIYGPETFSANLVVGTEYNNAPGNAILIEAFRTSSFVRNSFSADEVKKIEEAVREWAQHYVAADKITFYKKDEELSDFIIYFLKRCEEYKEMFETRNKYVSDIKLPITPSYTTDLDSIEIMMRCRDPHILEKMVQGSDWQNYPLTTNLVLELSQGLMVRNSATSLFLNAIDYDTFRYSNPEAWGKNRIISPDDWNLAQRMIMRKFNLDEEKGGFINPSSSIFDDSYLKWVSWCMRRVYIKPHYISEPTPFPDLWSLLKIS